MGLDINSVRFLLAARQSGVAFESHPLTLGRQWLQPPPERILEALGDLPGDRRQLRAPDGYSEDFLREIGAGSVEALDVSSFEGAVHVHDLNEPLPESLQEQFDVVIDGGTLEHIFNVPQAMKNVMELVKIGGRAFFFSPTNNWCGHGFVQLSPEFFYRSLSPANGYRIERMLAFEWGHETCYAVPDPADVQSRVEIDSGDWPVILMVQAIRELRCPIFERFPQQSDYAATWVGNAWRTKHSHRLQSHLPPRLWTWIRHRVRPLTSRGTLRDRRRFKPVRP